MSDLSINDQFLKDDIIKNNINTFFIYIIIFIIFILILFFIILLLFFIIILPLHILFNKISDNSWNYISNVPLFKLYKYHFINYLFHNTNNINFSYIYNNNLFYYHSFNLLLILSFFLFILLFIFIIYYSLTLLLSIPFININNFNEKLPNNFTFFIIIIFIFIYTIILWIINSIVFNNIIYKNITNVYIKSKEFDKIINKYFIKNDNIIKNILNSSISDILYKYIDDNYTNNIFLNYIDNKTEVQKIIFTFFLSKYIQHTYIEVHDTSNYTFNINTKIINYLKDPINSKDTFIAFLSDNVKFNEFVYNNFNTIIDIIPTHFINDNNNNNDNDNDNNNDINWNLIQQDFETYFNFSYNDYNFDITYSIIMFFISLIIIIISIIFYYKYYN